MKSFPFILSALFVLALLQPGAQAVEHEWTNTRDQTVKAEFISATADTVTISMKGKNFVVKLSDLNPESQALARKLAAGVPAEKLTPEELPTIGFSALSLGNPFFKEIAAGMKAEARKQGAEVLVMDANFQPQRQTAQIDDFIARKVKAIVLVPLDRIAIGPAIIKANQAGIPVFTIDSQCTAEGVQISGHVGVDNSQGGQLAGQAMIEALGAKGGQVLVLGFKIAKSCVQRVAGFKKVIDAHNKNGEGGKIEIVAELNGGANRRDSYQVTTDMLVAHPDLAGIFAINDPSALGAYLAVKEVGQEKQVKIIGFDGQKEGRDAIKEGKIYADAIQFPDRMGMRMVENIHAQWAGKEFKQVDLIPLELFRKADANAVKPVTLEPETSLQADPEQMVRGIAKAFAAKDYDAFGKFTCLGMGKDAFKQFMSKNDDRKVRRTWDSDRDDFEGKLVTEMREAFSKITLIARAKGFDWSQAKVVECEVDGDVKAKLRSGDVELYLHLDDCFLTPQGLLMFDAPRAR